ncbi:MAG: glycoside hydrolase [Bryobacterales bacterium]|nr:glycoside hydrolase [Bryobacterales bacterium]
MMRRRDFLTAAAASPLVAATHGVKRRVFLPSPGKGTAVMAYAYYTKPTGGGMISVEQRLSRSDTIDISYYRKSSDNGRTWSQPKAVPTGEKRPDGVWRKHPRAAYVDPHTGRLLQFWLEGILPSDDPLEGMKQWNVYYRIGENGETRQVIAEGREFGPRHPLPAVYTGKNSMMLGDLSCTPVTASDGTILLPLEITPIGPNGEYYNPGGGYTYSDAALALGRWKGGRLVWQASEHIVADPRKSTRGMVEPTVEILDGGRVLVVMRGSNDKKPELPSYRWVAYSSDGGRSFTKPAPWTYDTGEPFFSPSSCSQLLKHSSGRLFWLGNITPANPRGNRPRYPFVIGEVDRHTGLLGKKSVRRVDGRQPGESDILTLSNFFAHEDRETKEIVLYMTRLFAFPNGWEGDGMIYRIEV